MSRCIVCNSTVFAEKYRGIVQCKVCGHIFADLELSDEELLDLYKKEYFFGEEYSNYVADKAVLQKNFKLRMQVLQRFVQPAVHKHLLEIGSAYGFFLEYARPLFQTARGVDITVDGVEYARHSLQLDVALGDFLEVELSGPPPDVVCLWDTIEHLRHPDRYIEKASAQLKQGGLLALTTGDIDSLMARLRKERWRLIHPPTHIHYFSQRTIARLLNRYGFDVIYRRSCGFYRSMDNVLYNILVLRQQNQPLYNLFRRLGLTRLDFYLNMYDIMYVIARKRAPTEPAATQRG